MDSNPLPPLRTLDGPVEKKRSGVRKLLLGIGCGCAVSLALIFGALFWAYSYYFGAGVQVPSDHVLGPDTTAFVHLSPGTDSESTRALITSLLETIASIDPESIDEEANPGLRDMVEAMSNVDVEAANQILEFIPSSFTVAFVPRPDAPGSLDFVAALNLKSGSRLVRKLVTSFGSEGAIEHASGDHVILEFPRPDGRTDGPGDFITFQHDTLLFGTSLAQLEATLQRTDFDEEPGPPPASPMREGLERLSEKWLLSASAGGAQPLPAEFLQLLLADVPEDWLPADERAWLGTPAGAARLGCGLSGANLDLRFELSGLADGDLESVRAGLERLVALVEERLSAEGLQLDHETLAGEGAVVLKARLPGFRAWLNDKVKGLADS